MLTMEEIRIDSIKTPCIKEAQENDPLIGEIIRGLRDNNLEVNKLWGKETRLLYIQRKNLYFDRKGLLRRRGGPTKTQLVLPKSLRELVYRELHVEMGHLGPDRVFNLAKGRVYWPKMYSDITNFINSQCQCLTQKKPHISHEAVLQSIHSSAPMDLVALLYEYVLLIVDHFTRYAQGYATKNKSASTAAKCLYSDFVLRFGLPTKILHDQGKEFENNLFKEIEKLTQVKKLRTTPYHPNTNGCVERMNATPLAMPRTLPETSKSKWNEKLNKLLYAYNCTQHDSTGFSPYFLMFGREPNLPIDYILNENLVGEHAVTHSEYARMFTSPMNEVYIEDSEGEEASDVGEMDTDSLEGGSDVDVTVEYDVPEETVDVNEESDMNEEDSQSLEVRSSNRVRVPKKRFTYVPGVPTAMAIQEPHPIYFDNHCKQNNHLTLQNTFDEYRLRESYEPPMNP